MKVALKFVALALVGALSGTHAHDLRGSSVVLARDGALPSKETAVDAMDDNKNYNNKGRNTHETVEGAVEVEEERNRSKWNAGTKDQRAPNGNSNNKGGNNKNRNKKKCGQRCEDLDSEDAELMTDFFEDYSDEEVEFITDFLTGPDAVEVEEEENRSGNKWNEGTNKQRAPNGGSNNKGGNNKNRNKKKCGRRCEDLDSEDAELMADFFEDYSDEEVEFITDFLTGPGAVEVEEEENRSTWDEGTNKQRKPNGGSNNKGGNNKNRNKKKCGRRCEDLDSEDAELMADFFENYSDEEVEFITNFLTGPHPKPNPNPHVHPHPHPVPPPRM